MNDKKAWFGADLIGIAEQKVAGLHAHIDGSCDLSASLALDDLQPTRKRR